MNTNLRTIFVPKMKTLNTLPDLIQEKFKQKILIQGSLKLEINLVLYYDKAPKSY